jgi:hypothetical protein
MSDAIQAALDAKDTRSRPTVEAAATLAHVEGCPKNFSVPVDLCECGGRVITWSPSVEAAEIADLKAQNSLLTKGAGIQAGCAKVNAQASKAEIERLKTEAAEIRRQAFDEAIAIVNERTGLWAERWSRSSVRPEFYEEADHRKKAALALSEDAINALEAARDAAPIPSENDSGIEAT